MLFSDIVKVYNPAVSGFSKGWGPVWLESVSHLNLANPGDKSEYVPTYYTIIKHSYLIYGIDQAT